jgi:hypothetical protein
MDSVVLAAAAQLDYLQQQLATPEQVELKPQVELAVIPLIVIQALQVLHFKVEIRRMKAAAAVEATSAVVVPVITLVVPVVPVMLTV